MIHENDIMLLQFRGLQSWFRFNTKKVTAEKGDSRMRDPGGLQTSLMHISIQHYCTQEFDRYGVIYDPYTRVPSAARVQGVRGGQWGAFLLLTGG